jgi:hypothetical protein
MHNSVFEIGKCHFNREIQFKLEKDSVCLDEMRKNFRLKVSLNTK